MGRVGLLSQETVGLAEEGKISLPALAGPGAGARDWVEVEPFVWRDTGTGERLAAEVKDGRVVRWSIDAGSPFMVFEPAPASVNAAWLNPALVIAFGIRSEEHTSELQSLMRISYAVFCLKKKRQTIEEP